MNKPNYSFSPRHMLREVKTGKKRHYYMFAFTVKLENHTTPTTELRNKVTLTESRSYDS